MEVIIKIIIFLALAAVASAQTRIAPPQPDYSQYGSLSRQMTVYENLRLREEKLEKDNERRRREAYRRDTPQFDYVVVERPFITYREERSCSFGPSRHFVR